MYFYKKSNQNISRVESKAIIQYLVQREKEIEQEPIFKESNKAFAKIRELGLPLFVGWVEQPLSSLPSVLGIEPRNGVFFSGAFLFGTEKDSINKLKEALKNNILEKEEGSNSESINKVNKVRYYLELKGKDILETFFNKYKDIIIIDGNDTRYLSPDDASVHEFIQKNPEWRKIDKIKEIMESAWTKDDFGKIKENLNNILPGDTSGIRNCTYCGKTIEKINLRSDPFDRVNNLETYLKSNVVLACGKCNSLKGKLDVIDFVNRSKAVSNFIGQKDIDAFIEEKKRQLQSLALVRQARLNNIKTLFKIATHNKSQELFQEPLQRVHIHNTSPDGGEDEVIFDSAIELNKDYIKVMKERKILNMQDNIIQDYISDSLPKNLKEKLNHLLDKHPLNEAALILAETLDEEESKSSDLHKPHDDDDEDFDIPF